MGIVRDYNKVQGCSNPTDLTTQIVRDINVRYVTVENSSPHSIGVAVMPYVSGPTPPIRFLLHGGEIKHLAINSQGDDPQAIWLIDPKTKRLAGDPTLFHRHVNSFVLRDGVNKWWVQFFSRPSYRAGT